MTSSSHRNRLDRSLIGRRRSPRSNSSIRRDWAVLILCAPLCGCLEFRDYPEGDLCKSALRDD